uniref:Uncharacterized protein n=1 Tax=Salix viminalis TaxID=40686 RepID=A0A6N2KNV8_SALVM
MNLGLLGGQQRRHGVFASHVQSHAGIQEPEIEVKISSTEKFERLALVASYLSMVVLFEPTYWLVHEIVLDFWSSKGSIVMRNGMKNSLPRRQHKKKVPKTITVVNLLKGSVLCCSSVALLGDFSPVVGKHTDLVHLEPYRFYGDEPVSFYDLLLICFIIDSQISCEEGSPSKHFEAKQLKERTGSLQCAVTSQD